MMEAGGFFAEMPYIIVQDMKMNTSGDRLFG
jgi:hypothetical protein